MAYKPRKGESLNYELPEFGDSGSSVPAVAERKSNTWRPQRAKQTAQEKKYALDEWKLFSFLTHTASTDRTNTTITILPESLDALPSRSTISVDAARRMAAAFPDKIKKKKHS